MQKVHCKDKMQGLSGTGEQKDGDPDIVCHLLMKLCHPTEQFNALRIIYTPW
jgi:hypothetical protein